MTTLNFVVYFRYHEENRGHNELPRGSSLPRLRPSQISNFSDSSVPSPNQKNTKSLSPPPSQSVPRKATSSDRRKSQGRVEMIELDPILLSKTPILCNRYVLDKNEMLSNTIPGITLREMEGQGKTSPPSRRAKSLPKNPHTQYLEPPRFPSPESSSDSSLRKSPRLKRKKSPCETFF